MPRGRPRKNATEAELLPLEEDQPKVREIKHKTEWIEVAPVEGTSEDDSADFEGVEIEDKPRKRNKNAIQEMRKKLRAQGVTPTSNLRLYIERYVHSETDAGGSWAETEFCTKYSTTEEHIFNKDYIDAARKWGHGKYRITIRMDNRIVDAFDERISATPSGPVIQQVNPNDPNSPQFIIQTNGDGQQPSQPMSMRDIMKQQKDALKEHLEMAKLMREAYGFTPEQQQPRSEEEVLTSAILKQPDVIETVVGNLVKRVGGKGGGDDEPWYADAVKDAIKSGQGAQIVKTAIDALFNGFKGLFPGGQNNGQAQMATAPLQTSGTVDGQGATDGRNVVSQEVPQGNQSLQSGSGEANSEGGMLPAATSEEQALTLLIDHCRRNAPVNIAFDRLISYADWLNDNAPQYSIDGYLDLLGTMTTDQVIEFVKTLPGGEQVVALPHAKEWCAGLQRLIKESQEGGEE